MLELSDISLKVCCGFVFVFDGIECELGKCW